MRALDLAQVSLTRAHETERGRARKAAWVASRDSALLRHRRARIQRRTSACRCSDVAYRGGQRRCGSRQGRAEIPSQPPRGRAPQDSPSRCTRPRMSCHEVAAAPIARLRPTDVRLGRWGGRRRADARDSQRLDLRIRAAVVSLRHLPRFLLVERLPRPSHLRRLGVGRAYMDRVPRHPLTVYIAGQRGAATTLGSSRRRGKPLLSTSIVWVSRRARSA